MSGRTLLSPQIYEQPGRSLLRPGKCVFTPKCTLSMGGKSVSLSEGTSKCPELLKQLADRIQEQEQCKEHFRESFEGGKTNIIRISEITVEEKKISINIKRETSPLEITGNFADKKTLYNIAKKCSEVAKILSPVATATSTAATGSTSALPSLISTNQEALKKITDEALNPTKAVSEAIEVSRLKEKLKKLADALKDKYSWLSGIIYKYFIPVSDQLGVLRNPVTGCADPTIVSAAVAKAVTATNVVPVLRILQGFLFILQGIVWVIDGIKGTKYGLECREARDSVDNVLATVGAVESVGEGVLWIVIGVGTLVNAPYVSQITSALFNVVFPVSFGIMIIQGINRLIQTVQWRMRVHTYLEGIENESKADESKKAARIRDFFMGEVTITANEESAIRFKVKNDIKMKEKNQKEVEEVIKQRIRQKIRRKVLRLKACTSEDFVNELLIKGLINEEAGRNLTEACQLQTLLKMAYQANSKAIAKAIAKTLIGIAGFIGSFCAAGLSDVILWAILNLMFLILLDWKKTTDPLFEWKFTNKEIKELGLAFDPSLPFRAEALRFLPKDKEYAKWSRDQIGKIFTARIDIPKFKDQLKELKKQQSSLPYLRQEEEGPHVRMEQRIQDIEKKIASLESQTNEEKLQQIFNQLPQKFRLHLSHDVMKLCDDLRFIPEGDPLSLFYPITSVFHSIFYTSADPKPETPSAAPALSGVVSEKTPLLQAV